MIWGARRSGRVRSVPRVAAHHGLESAQSARPHCFCVLRRVAQGRAESSGGQWRVVEGSGGLERRTSASPHTNHRTKRAGQSQARDWPVSGVTWKGNSGLGSGAGVARWSGKAATALARPHKSRMPWVYKISLDTSSLCFFSSHNQTLKASQANIQHRQSSFQPNPTNQPKPPST